jgi:hypothetical protein
VLRITVSVRDDLCPVRHWCVRRHASRRTERGNAVRSLFLWERITYTEHTACVAEYDSFTSTGVSSCTCLHAPAAGHAWVGHV